MKNSIIIFMFLTVACTSCIVDHSTLTQFTVKNSSHHNVAISVRQFQTLYSQVDTTFILVPNATFTYEYNNDGKNAPWLYPFGSNSDFVLVVFDNGQSVLYTRNDSNPRNILRIENYSGGKVSDLLYKYNYTITEADYQQALEQHQNK